MPYERKKMKLTNSFTVEQYSKSDILIIYGASVWGEIAYYALRQLGIRPNFFCDRGIQKDKYYGIPVLRPHHMINFQEAQIVIASADYFHDIRKYLLSVGCKKLFDMEALLAMNLYQDDWSKRAKDIFNNKSSYLNVLYHTQNDEDVNFSRIQFVVSERCSLKCKDCTHLMQYYQSPQDVDLEKYKGAFDLLLSAIRCVSEIRILGGEPFMNRQMYKVIEWYHDNGKIQNISVYTNGTIIPDENNLRALTKEKVRLHISDYGLPSSKISQLVEVLDKWGIQYYVRSYDEWQDAGNLVYRDYSVDKMKNIFSVCYERNCFTFLKGKLHRCPRSAHAMNLGAMPDIVDDYIDLSNWTSDVEDLKNQLRKLQKKEYLAACNYCDGPNTHTQKIQPAIQAKNPLPFNIVEENIK